MWAVGQPNGNGSAITRQKHASRVKAPSISETIFDGFWFPFGGPKKSQLPILSSKIATWTCLKLFFCIKHRILEHFANFGTILHDFVTLSGIFSTIFC